MKKFLSIVMVFVILFLSIPPIQVDAAEQSLSDYDQLISLATNIFPEYAERINNSQISPSSKAKPAISQIYPVVQETRIVDSSTIMTYTEHNNGIVTLGTARFSEHAYITETDSETHSQYELFTATITATVLEGSKIFEAYDVKYKIYPSNYDRITDVGNYVLVAPNGSSNSGIICNSNNTVETASTAAEVIYTFPIIVGYGNYHGTVTFTIRNNNASVGYVIS